MISRALCEEVLAAAASTGADYAELFAEKTFNRSVSMLDSRVQQSNDNVVAGVGIRVFKGLRSVAASTVDTSREGLLRCAAWRRHCTDLDRPQGTPLRRYPSRTPRPRQFSSCRKG